MDQALEEIRTHACCRTMWQYAQEGFALVSTEGVIRAANPKLCAILGYTEMELLGKTVGDVTERSSDLEEDLRNFRLLVAGEIESYEMIKQYRTKDQRVVVGRLRVSKIAPDRLMLLGSVIPVDRLDVQALPSDVRRRVLAGMVGEWALAHWKLILLGLGILVGAEQVIARLLAPQP
jgi:PAS domain S-box-containing protein